MADQTNPFTMMGMAGMMMPNPYTQYKGALPMPGYMGTPTDAQGKPIQSYLDAQAQHDAWDQANPAPAQGTTLNSPPASMDQMIAASRAESPSPRTTTVDTGGFGGVQRYTAYDPQFPLQTPQPAAPAAAQTNPVDMRQAYLTALSNPGKVTTPGATVPIKQPLGTPSVLQSFLANNPGGGSSMPGGYTNKPFFAALNNLQGSAA